MNDLVWRWRKTLPERKGMPCRELARATRAAPNGNRLIEFEDGYKTVAPHWSVCKRPQAETLF